MAFSLSLPSCLLAVLGLVSPGPETGAREAQELLRIVTTIPDLADIARRVGGDAVRVDCIARGSENLHSVRLRPSHMVVTNKADIFIQVGLALEHSWVPGLLESSRNRRIAIAGPLNVGDGWPGRIEIPVTLDRTAGVDIHPLGNPHINLHPGFGPFAARKIRDRLKEERPQSAEMFDERCAAYEKLVAGHAKRWSRISELLKGRKVVQYHKEFSYLCKANGLEMVGALEPKPGVPPTPGHLAKLAVKMREQEVRVVLHGPWTPGRVAKDAAQRAGARAVELQVMTQREGDSWHAFMDRSHEALLEAWGLELQKAEPGKEKEDG